MTPIIFIALFAAKAATAAVVGELAKDLYHHAKKHDVLTTIENKTEQSKLYLIKIYSQTIGSEKIASSARPDPSASSGVNAQPARHS